jgi:hypothetical protein
MGIVRYGVHAPLENAADELIFGSLKGVTSQKAKSDILTRWKEHDRRSREVMSRSGTVDPAIRRGMYHRAANKSMPHLNSRDGVAPAQKLMMTAASPTMNGISEGGHDSDDGD